MALLPYLDAPEQSVEMLAQFGGYNHRISIGENEFFDMQNMSAKDYPLASTRIKRGTVNAGTEGIIANAQGIVAKERLIVPFTAQGGIGVNIASDVAADDLESVPGIEIDSERYTVVDMAMTNPVIGFMYESERLGIDTYYYRLTQTENGLKYEDLKKYKRPEWLYPEKLEENPHTPSQFLIKWPHEKLISGTCWAEGLTTVKENKSQSKLEESNEITLKVENSKYLSDISMSWGWLNPPATCYIGKCDGSGYFQEIKLKSIGSSVVNDVRDLTITWEGTWGAGKISSNETKIIFLLTDPLAEEIPSRNLIDYIRTEVSVSAVSAAAVRALLNQDLSINGNTYHVSQVKTVNEQFYIYIDKPHDALTQGDTVIGERLFLAEVNPADGLMITSNICAASSGRRQLLEMGGNLVIFPEKVMVNTLNKNLDGQFNDIQFLEFTNILQSTYKYRLCDINGNFYDNGSASNTAPSSPSEGHAWIDTSDEPPILKVWSEQTSQWAKTQPYCQLYSTSVSESWQVGDAFEIEFGADGGGEYLAPQKDQKYFVVSAVGKDEEGRHFVRFPVAMTAWSEVSAGDPTDTIMLKRTVPEMDFIIENENRLWGCKYGMVDGKMINEIFACKLGDPKNWNYFTNTAIDSYYVSMGADGAFTGAISYGGNPLFFREDCMHRIYGNYPANYALKTMSTHGVEAGSDKSLTVMNDVLFYKSPVGIMAYTGATPVNVSENFGNEKYKNAVAKALGNKMFFSMKDSRNTSHLFAFDDRSKLWHKEDNLACKDFAVYDGEIYALTEENRIVSMAGVSGTAEDDFEWNLISGNIGYTTPYRKRISKLNIRLLLDLSSRASISIQYDSSGFWEHINTLKPAGKVRSVVVPIMPHRCDHFALKIQGVGICKILSVTKYIEEGSDYD